MRSRLHRILATLLLLLLTSPLAAAQSAEEIDVERQAILDRVERLRENADAQSDSERLAAFIDLYFEYATLEFPELATYLGLPTGQDRWADQSLAADERRDAELRQALELLRSIHRTKLEGDDRLSYDLLMDNVEQGVAGQRFLGEFLALNQMGGVQQNVAQMMAMMPGRNVRDYENLLARFQGVPRLVETTLERLRKGLEAGVTPPKVTLRDVPQQILNLLPDNAEESALLRRFTSMPESLPEADRERIREEALTAYNEHVAPAFRQLHAYLTETYIPGCRESIGMKDLPDGVEWYAHNARQSTTTDMTPQEIHEIGLAEVARIRAEMDKVIADSGFEGSFEEFTELLRTDPRFYFTDAEELLRTYRDIAKRADAELPKLFGNLPRLPYGVIPVPEYAQKSQTTAYYQPGALESGRPGYFFANTYALDTRPKWEMEALTLHEAVPGHHLQIAIGQEIEEIPWFRRMSPYTAYVEGWGLYSESLGVEMGFYQDPYSKFGQLTYEIWRAIRLVVDTGMHVLGWSRQQAIDYFLANTGKQEHDIVVEVDRYIVWPGQALAYKIGELKIKELRALAEKELGESFDIRAFHDTVLGNGALPLAVLEIQVREWIESQRAPEVASPLPVG